MDDTKQSPKKIILSDNGKKNILDNLSQTSLSSDQKEKLIRDLIQILNDERALDLIEREDSNIFNEDKESLFSKHNELINIAYGDNESFLTFNINNDAVELLAGHLLSQKTLLFSEITSVAHEYLMISNLRPDKYKALDENLIIFDFEMTDLIQKLHQSLRNPLANYVKSPFSILNTRAWVTKPGSVNVGPNAQHTDGFAAGHLKLMIYLTPLNDDFGKLAIENKLLTSASAGACIIFKNSDVPHNGIPGLKYPRICIEITLLRTFINCQQFHDSHPNGAHYFNLSTPYLRNDHLFL